MPVLHSSDGTGQRAFGSDNTFDGSSERPTLRRSPYSLPPNTFNAAKIQYQAQRQAGQAPALWLAAWAQAR